MRWTCAKDTKIDATSGALYALPIVFSAYWSLTNLFIQKSFKITTEQNSYLTEESEKNAIQQDK